MRQEERFLALGGVHALDGAEPCHLTRVEPATALEDQHWKDSLVVRANAEGSAELVCGAKKTRLVTVKPARLDLVLVEDHVVVGQRFHVRAIPRDGAGKEVEIGRWTEVKWQPGAHVTRDEDKSAGEFGLGGGSSGVAAFSLDAMSPAEVKAQLGGLVGALRVTPR